MDGWLTFLLLFCSLLKFGFLLPPKEEITDLVSKSRSSIQIVAPSAGSLATQPQEAEKGFNFFVFFINFFGLLQGGE